MGNKKLCQTAWARGLAPNETPRETFSLPDFDLIVKVFSNSWKLSTTTVEFICTVRHYPCPWKVASHRLQCIFDVKFPSPKLHKNVELKEVTANESRKQTSCTYQPNKVTWHGKGKWTECGNVDQSNWGFLRSDEQESIDLNCILCQKPFSAKLVCFRTQKRAVLQLH